MIKEQHNEKSLLLLSLLSLHVLMLRSSGSHLVTMRQCAGGQKPRSSSQWNKECKEPSPL